MSWVNENELRVIGMSRSGNHAIIYWLLSQISGPFCFLNCAEPAENPFHSARPLGHEAPFETNIPDFEFEAAGAGRHQRRAWLIHSYEDVFLRKLAETRETPGVGRSRDRTDLLILRDPFNLFASRRRFGLFSQDSGVASYIVTPRTAVRIWKQHAKQFLRRRRILKGRVITVSYLAWTKSFAYRKALADQLGLSFSDAGFGFVPDTAGGSSFDKRTCLGRPQAMKVHERWKHYAHDPSFLELFDDEMLELCREIFGPMEEIFTCIRERQAAPVEEAAVDDVVSA